MIDFPNTPIELLRFVVDIVIIRGILSKKAASIIEKRMLRPFVSMLKRMLFKTERDVAIWMHYRNQAMKNGHSHKGPVECRDGKCLLI